MARRERQWSVATTLFTIQFVVIIAVGIVGFALTLNGSETDARRAAAGRTAVVAEAIAQADVVADALSSGDDGADMRSYLGAVTRDSDIDSIAVYRPDGSTYAASSTEVPMPSQKLLDDAFSGASTTREFDASTGASVRSLTPVRDEDGRVVGVIDATIDLDTIRTSLTQRVWTLVLSGFTFIVVIGASAWGLSRYLRRVTWGRGAAELSRMFQFYDSGLRAIGDGIVLADADAKVVLVNDAARRLLDLGDDVAPGAPTDADDVEVPPEVVRLLHSPSAVEDALVLTSDRVLVVSAEPVTGPNGKRIGTIATVRDHTRLQELAGEVDTATTLADALRSQTHEFANRLHTIIALIELDRVDEAVEFASSEVDTSQRLAEQLVETVGEPFLTALLLGKSAQANERGIRFDLEVTGTVVSALPARDIVTIVGNLIDNAMDASTRTPEPAVHVDVVAEPGSLQISVSDSGPGPDPAEIDRLFELGVTTKRGGPQGRGIGLALVRQSVRRLGGTLSVEGSEFAVRLPNPGHPSNEAPDATARAEAAGKGHP